MSSITKLPNGRRAIHFYGHDGKRRTLRLGKVSLKDAERYRVHVDELVSASRFARSPNDETEAWLGIVPDATYRTLQRAGLASSRHGSATKLGDALQAMIDTRKDWKQTQRRAMTTARRHLIEYYGAERLPASITLAEAKAYRHHLIGKKYATATISKQIKCARSYFAFMVESKMIRTNHFTQVETGSQDNPARWHFVSEAVADKLIAACPNDEWRVIIALARYGGVRMPSEMLPLRWRDVQWAGDKIRISSPKTAGSGKAERWCPLWPKLRAELARLAKGGTSPDEHVIQVHRFSPTALREGIMLRIKDAGLTPWDKVWQNLRSSCATDLMEQGYPMELIARWIGNTPKVLQQHYAQTRDEQFAVAVRRASKSASVTVGLGHSSPAATPVIDAETRIDMPGQPLTVDSMGPLGLTRLSKLGVNPETATRRASNSASRRDEWKAAPSSIRSSYRKVRSLTRNAGGGK